LRHETPKGKRARLWLDGGFAISILDHGAGRFRILIEGHVAEWLRTGLQNRLRRFNSGRGLHSISDPDLSRRCFGAPPRRTLRTAGRADARRIDSFA
jgi:hypothetical protein